MWLGKGPQRVSKVLALSFFLNWEGGSKVPFLKVFFILMWIIFKVFAEFVTIMLLFYIFWFFDLKACGILVP